MKELKLQKLLGVIASAFRYLKNIVFFGNNTKYLVGGKFKKHDNHQDLIDINTIDITNLKTEMFCDLKVDSNKLKDIVGDFIFIKEFVKGNCADKYSIDYFKLFTPEDEYGDNEDNQINAICDYLIGLHDKGKYLDSDIEEMYGNRVRELYLIRQNDRDIKITKQSLIHSDCLMSIKNPDRRN